MHTSSAVFHLWVPLKHTKSFDASGHLHCDHLASEALPWSCANKSHSRLLPPIPSSCHTKEDCLFLIAVLRNVLFFTVFVMHYLLQLTFSYILYTYCLVKVQVRQHMSINIC